jgi:hypothetical protein
MCDKILIITSLHADAIIDPILIRTGSAPYTVQKSEHGKRNILKQPLCN